MTVPGWIKLHRKVFDNPIWLSEPFTRGQAWVDMLMLTNHSDGYIRSNGKRVELLRGELGWSELSLGERWKWSRGKVKRFINELIRDQQIVQRIVQRSSIISICNYSEYQGAERNDGTTVDTIDGQRTGQQTDNEQDTNKNVKKEKKEKKYTEEDFRVARFMFGKILEINTGHKEPDFDKWANDVRLMRERDKRSHGEMRDLFAWANKDSFWSRNILSPAKLREKWDQLVIQMKQPRAGGSNNTGSVMTGVINEILGTNGSEVGGSTLLEIQSDLPQKMG